ncbi:MAG: sensor histidine kinase [Bacillota bacterium]|jgi:signal transduction histidine kinase
MRIFTDKRVKFQFIVIVIALVLFTLLGQLVVKHMAEDYKQSMITHDYGIAGDLMHGRSEKTSIGQAFTSEKTQDDIEAGQDLLQALGYTRYIQNSLLPEVELFYRKFTVISLALSAIFSVVILIVVLYFALLHNKKIEKANTDIQSFMSGNIGIRLDDHEESSLSKLFTSVNAMATAQAAHIAKEKQNNEFLIRTISDISHQLKTPLSALKMYNEIMQAEKVGNEVMGSFIIKSERELNRMETLIKNLLKLARLNTDSIELEKKTQNLKRILGDSIRGFRTRAELEDKVILLRCNENIAFSFDEDWLREAVDNIIKNALDHTRAKDKIEIQCDDTPLFTKITISDTGTGIHPDDIHHIFKRFYRSRFSKDKQGIGIGLALSKAIVEKHGGSITVESELKRGTFFRLVFSKLSNM